jgi:hypothetical protein
MDLKTHLTELSFEQRQALATACKTSLGHLKNVMYGLKPCSAELAALLERESGGAVRRWDTRPADWHLVWPELVGIEGAPPTEDEQTVDAKA